LFFQENAHVLLKIARIAPGRQPDAAHLSEQVLANADRTLDVAPGRVAFAVLAQAFRGGAFTTQVMQADVVDRPKPRFRQISLQAFLVRRAHRLAERRTDAPPQTRRTRRLQHRPG